MTEIAKTTPSLLEAMATSNPPMVLNLLAATAHLHGVIEMGREDDLERLSDLLKGSKNREGMILLAFKIPRREPRAEKSAAAPTAYTATTSSVTVLQPVADMQADPTASRTSSP